MKKINYFALFLLCLSLILTSSSVKSKNIQSIEKKNINLTKETLKKKRRIKSDLNFGNFPLYFISNKGQVDKKANFYTKTSQYTLWLTKEGLIFDSIKKEKIKSNSKKFNSKLKTNKTKFIGRDISKFLFIDANKAPEIIPVKESKHRVNYFIGKDKSKWYSNIPTSKAVLYKSLYKNIDLKVYGIEKQIEYDWIVSPGGNPENIKFEYKNIKRVHIDEQGDLIINTKFGTLIHKKPISYQLINRRQGTESREERKKVNVKFKKISKNIYGFSVGDYDKTIDLIIDPMVLGYSTYLGGNGDDYGYGIAVDNSGNVYVTGEIGSIDFPNTFSEPDPPMRDVFVAKINTNDSGATSLIYSTYLGGDDNDYGYGITVDSSGYAYVTGKTVSTDFPTLNQYQTDADIGDSASDAFLTKLSIDGSTLEYSTYLGGDSVESGWKIAVDNNETVYITGETDSTDFPTLNQYQTDADIADNDTDAFLTKIDTTLTGSNSLIYSTYLGGNSTDRGYGIAIDSSNNVYIAGGTDSTDFPTLNEYQTDSDIGDNDTDAFVSKVNTSLTGTASLIYSTYLGGNHQEYANSISVDSNANAYITGGTDSSDFPIKNAYQSGLLGSVDAFITKLSPTGDSLIYSTYLGGSTGPFIIAIGFDEGIAIKVDNNGNAYVTGDTGSSDFPTKDPYQSDLSGLFDAFIVKLSIDGNSLDQSTYLGGGSVEGGRDIAVDNNGVAYIIGETDSTDFPTLNQYQTDADIGDSDTDAFITRFGFTPTITTSTISSITTSTSEGGGNVTKSGGSSVSARGVCWSTSPNPDISDSHTIDSSGTGIFTSNITGLSPATTYYVRAYATNDSGTGYGNELRFSTNVTVSGTVTDGVNPIEGVIITFSHNNHTETTDSSGNYSYALPYETTTTIIPSHAAVTSWTPDFIALADITSDQPDQDFLAVIITSSTISGTITSGGSGLENVIMNGLPGTPITNASGYYSANVIFDWSGTVTPSLTGYIFSPASITYSNVTNDQSNQNYTAISGNPVISGRVLSSGGTGISGVTLTFSNNGGSVTTDINGNYSHTVLSGWTGIATPSLTGYIFSPINISYTNVTNDQTNQNYAADITTGNPVISGTVSSSSGTGISGVTIAFSNSGGSVITNTNGNYSRTVPSDWSGTGTPSLAGYTFNPISSAYSDVTSNQTNQNYTAILSTGNPVISGTVWTVKGNPLSEVTLTFSNNGGIVTTDNKGIYSHTITSGWSGTIIPSKENYEFIPNSRTYYNVTSNYTNNDFTSIGIGSPEIYINRNQLNFGADKSDIYTGSQPVLIENTSGGTLNWTLSSNQNWLKFSPASGTNSGIVSVSVDVSKLNTGTYSGAISISDPMAGNSPKTINVSLRVNNSTKEPFGVFSSPLEHSTVYSSIPVTGWALDDVEVENIKIYYEAGSTLVYIGDAVFVEGTRPDVELAYQNYPMNYRAGWGYMLLTNFFPNNGNGAYTLHAIAIDKEGNKVTLGTKMITIDNTNAVKPFGAIDTPEQGGIAAGGKFINWGWALTPKPNTIPINGSTINVYVDGINLGNPIYNNYRKDINTLFPEYNNSKAAVGYFYLDTTAYKNGLHTIQWTVTDDAGNTDGIGSRFFSIQNLTQNKSAKGSSKIFRHYLSDIAKINPSSVLLKKGYGQADQKRISPGKKGIINIETREIKPLEIRISSKLSQLSGHMIIGKKMTPLPIGSTLKDGVFYWTPGPGFFGKYKLIFIEKGENGIYNKKELLIKINPKFTGS